MRDKLVVSLVTDFLWINKEEDVEEEEELKEEMIENRDGLIEEETINGGFKEEGIEKNEGLERKEEFVNGNNFGFSGKEDRRKGEELWLEMWGKEMECREMEREKERVIMENQRLQVSKERGGGLMLISCKRCSTLMFF